MKSKCLRSLSDAEGKGIAGCLLFLVLIGVAIYFGIVLGPIYYANFNFESAVKTEISRAGAHFLDDEILSKDILDLARRNEIRLKREEISIDRFAGQVHVKVQYAVPVDFIILTRNLVFRIEGSSFVGAL